MPDILFLIDMQIHGAGCIHFLNWKNSYIPNILQEIYLQKIYNQFLSGKKDLTLLDLGSNIGLWSMYAAQYAKQVYAFEPAKETYDVAVKNITDNNLTNVKLIQKAIDTKDGTMTLFHNENSTMNSLSPFVNTKPENAEEVKTLRLDTFVKNEKIERIHFAKIDVEGIEDRIFASESFKNIVPVLDSFIYEWHSWSNSNPNIINGGLRDYGYEVKQIPSDATIFGCAKV